MVIRDVDLSQLDALIERLKLAQANEFALQPGDIELILNMLLSFATLQQKLSDKDITLFKLRKLLGIVSADERLSKLLENQAPAGNETNKPGADESTPKQEENKTPKPRSPNKKQPPAAVVHHPLTELQKTLITCPECGMGKLYKYSPAEFIRVKGLGPFVAEKHVLERKRCNACGEYFTAPLSGAAAEDGLPEQKYGYSARTLMAIQKYYMGAPFYRQQSLQTLLHTPISASTISDQCYYVAMAGLPIYTHLNLLAADADKYETDDTSNKILYPGENPNPHLSAVKTTGLIATLSDGKRIVSFNTAIGHAGLHLDSILKERTTKTIPQVMSDAFNCNNTQADTIQINCNAHGRRQFVDVLSVFVDDVTWCLTEYGKIWHNDKQTTDLTPEARQAYHHEHSLPIMERIKKWCQDKQNNGEVEPNSGLGKAMSYFQRHYDKLVRFCHLPGARIDNNRLEATLKLVIRNRKNAGFFRSQRGADTSDVITTLIATCAAHEVNIIDYLNHIQRHQLAASLNPQDFLPWNFLDQDSQKIAA